MRRFDEYESATNVWQSWLAVILAGGRRVPPIRTAGGAGRSTREVPSLTMAFDLARPIVEVPSRKLSYRFMCAEALWMVDGDDRVSTIAPYCDRIASYSDDGQTFYGAYGPRFRAQLHHVVSSLSRETTSRQALATLWRPSPPEGVKDVPCTVAMQWMVRGGAIECHVFMRSSDAWLGVPYDWFNFSVMTYYVRHHLFLATGDDLALGGLHFTAASAHLYDEHLPAARACAAEGAPPPIVCPFDAYHWEACASRVAACRDGAQRRPF